MKHDVNGNRNSIELQKKSIATTVDFSESNDLFIVSCWYATAKNVLVIAFGIL